MASFIAVLVASTVVAGSSVNSDHHSVVRRHSDAVEMLANGEVKIVEAPSQESQPKQEAVQRLHSSAIDAMLDRVNMARTKEVDICDLNFTQGVPLKNNCSIPETQSLIEDQSLCEKAAKLSCPDESCIGDPPLKDFKITSTWFDKHPMRCFVVEDPDPTDPTKTVTKWFFNPSGYQPANIESGTPICQQHEFHEGDLDSSDCDSEHYTNIMDEWKCRNAAKCMSSCIHDEFRILDEAKKKLAPKGCHNSTLGCLQFNDYTGDDAVPKGTPICQHNSPGEVTAVAAAADPGADETAAADATAAAGTL